jgi:hypothetical protein
MANTISLQEKSTPLPMKNGAFSSENGQKQGFLPLISGVCSHCDKISFQL